MHAHGVWLPGTVPRFKVGGNNPSALVSKRGLNTTLTQAASGASVLSSAPPYQHRTNSSMFIPFPINPPFVSF